ncbi:hypothetical protein ACO0K7_18030 [Undibacterium sp. Ji67W]|uniref:hypothetical protein n=1 Tax=Undibacterium sp. Ji67W TaxID=3413042 RepID=UPI003BF3DAC6
MKEISQILIEAFRLATADLGISALSNVTDDTNIFELLDSLAVVNILLETEMMLEQETGNYVTLANETLFDAEKSPLRKWSSWVEYVGALHGK